MTFVNNAQGKAILTGPEWPRLTGQSLPKSLDLNWLERVHFEDRALVEDTHFKAVETQCEYSMRYRLLNPDGLARWVSVGARPSVGPPDYTFLGFLGSLTVLTNGATQALKAYGNVGLYVPPPSPYYATSDDTLDRIADHMLLATALIEESRLTSALLGVRHALYEIGFALASRAKQHRQAN